MGGTPWRLDVRPPTKMPTIEMIAYQEFGDLDGVESGTLAQIIGNDPEIEPMCNGRIAPNAADIDRILAGGLNRSHIPFVSAVIDNGDPGRAPQDGTRILFAERPLELDIDRLAVANEDRNPDAGR